MVKMILLFTLLACQNVEFAGSKGEDSSDDPPTQVADAVRTSPGKINRRLMIRNFRALNLTMSTLTDTPLQQEKDTVFTQINHMLASNNNIESFSATMQVGIFRLATSYCMALEDNNKALSALGLINSINGSNKKEVAEDLISKFWQDKLTIRANKDEAVSELVSLADTFLLAENPANNGENAFIGMCTAVLASASVTFH